MTEVCDDCNGCGETSTCQDLESYLETNPCDDCEELVTDAKFNKDTKILLCRDMVCKKHKELSSYNEGDDSYEITIEETCDLCGGDGQYGN